MHRRVDTQIAALAVTAAAVAAAPVIIESPARAAIPTNTGAVAVLSTTNAPKCSGTVTFTVHDRTITASFAAVGCGPNVPTSLTVGDTVITGSGTESLSATLPVCGDWAATATLDRRIINTTSGNTGLCDGSTQPQIITTVPTTAPTTTTAAETTTVVVPTTVMGGTTVPNTLPVTGSDEAPLVLAAVGLASVGAAAVLGTRRHQHQ